MWRTYAALGPARSPGDRGGAGAGGGAAEEPEGGLGAHGGERVGMRPPPWGARRLCFSHTAGRGGSFILKVFKRKLVLIWDFSLLF